MKFLLCYIFFLYELLGKNQNYYEIIIESLTPQDVKKSKDIKNWPIFQNFYEIVYLYPNFFFNYGVSLNYHELIQQTARKKTVIEQIIIGLLSLKIIDVLYQITINNFIRFYDGKSLVPSEEEKSIDERKTFLKKCLGIFLDNWFLDEWNMDDFFREIEIIQNTYNNDDKLFIYYSIINENFDVLQDILTKNQGTQNLLKFKHNCIFFPLLQIKYDGQYPEYMLYKITYPSRPNYEIIKHKFTHGNHSEPYLFCHRYVATQIYKSTPIKDLNFKNMIMESMKTNDEQEDKKILLDLKKKFLQNFNDINENIQWIMIIYFFIKKSKNDKFIDENKQYIYWLLCRYYSDNIYQEWIKKEAQAQSRG